MDSPQELMIICSVDSQPLLPKEGLESMNILWTSQGREKVLEILRDFQPPLLLLFCCPPSEAVAFEELFKSYPKRKMLFSLAVLGEKEPGQDALSKLTRLGHFRIGPMSPMEFTFLVQTEKQRLITELENLSALRSPNPEYLDQEGDQDSLIRIGKALNIERDPDKLLRTILYLSKKITGADAGSIFLVDGEEEEKKLRFKYSHTFSKELEYEEFCIPMDTSSIAGYVSVTGKTLNFSDVYELDGEGLFHFNSSFDETHGYRTKSMLVTPMVNHIGQTIGVIQLINSKENFHKLGHYSGNEAYEIILDSPGDFDRFVVPFKKRYEDLMEAVASQAAIALENSQMLRQIETQFEAFVKASVSAIESRDPATSGHSFRVAQMSVAIAKAINYAKSGSLKEEQFSEERIKELEYACLLHDFGKVYVDLDVIMKAKKFFPRDLEYLNLRMDFLQRSIELEILESQLDAKNGNNETLIHQLQEDRKRKASCIQEIKKSIQELNEPSIWVENRDQLIDDLIHKASILQANDCQGKSIPFLTEEELENLRITRGSLNQEERKHIESHVVHTYNFVKNIPWPANYKDIPDIAAKHHEMLNGSGYPYGLRAQEIPLQARIMAVADVFDALTASDRPYKKALPLEKALSILQEEVAMGRLDGELVSLFSAEKLYESIE